MAGAVIGLAGCLGGNSSDDENTQSSKVKLSGVISAPGGNSFAKVDSIGSQFANLFFKPLNAAISDDAPIGADVPVNLIDLSDGSILATGVTGTGGTFELDAPEGFTAAANYIIQAGSTESIEARVTGTTIDVDTLTHASSQLIREVATGSVLDNLSLEEVTQIEDEVADNLTVTEQDLDTLTQLDEITTELVTSLKHNEETINAITSKATSGEICGTVTNSNAEGLESILVVARDYGEWVTRAKTKTDANGAYCLNVPVADETVNGETHNGEFIVGAINRTGDAKDPLLSASEWYTADGGSAGQWGGDKVSLTATESSKTINFELSPGARIKGQVTALDSGTAASGVKVLIRDFKTWMPITGAKVKPDGTYKVNVPAGDYIVVARNKTNKALATEVFHDSAGDGTSDNDAFVRQLADKVSVIAGQKFTANFNLISGQKIGGQVLDNTNGNPVSGVRVRFDNSGFAAALRTNKNGKYRVWLKPDSYIVRSRGQTASVDISAGNAAQVFDAAVTPLTTTLTYNSNPTSEISVFLRDATTYSVVSQEVSNSDGSVTLYSPDSAANYILQVKVKDESSGAGSIVYKTQTDGNAEYATHLADGTQFTDATFPSAIRLPQGYEVTGTVTIDSVATGRIPVSARDGGTGSSQYNIANTSSLSTGEYFFYLPAGNYDQLLACVKGNSGCSTVKQSHNGVDVPLSSNTLDFTLNSN